MKKYLLIVILFMASVLSLAVGLTACSSNKEVTKSAYELYVEDYINATGSADNVLSEEEWLESQAWHNWDEGVITTNPTCITPGVITYACSKCGATKKELTDANGEHRWGITYDEVFHWHTCKICGEIEKYNHDFGDVAKDSDVDTLMECECGFNKTVGVFYSFKVIFECGDGVSVKVYDTQNYDNGGYISDVAYARDSETGELINNGDGQVNFELVIELGYKLKKVSISSKNYNKLKEPSDIDRENTYRITKITGELIVSIETEMDFLELPVMVINTKNNAPILDKENYVTCSVSILNAEEEYCFDGVGAGIRGRGNTTWNMPKKPYKLKFDSKVDLFGNDKAKKWTLIANYSDPSLIRNYLAYTIGAEFDGLKDTTTTVQFVDLYLNGQYDGVYLICEQNEVGKTRVDIEDDFINVSNPADIGYLLELDAWAPNESQDMLHYFSINDLDYGSKKFGVNEVKHYSIKSPDIDDMLTGGYSVNIYINYIKNYIENCMEVITRSDYSTVCELIDVDSFAESYIVYELFNNKDVGQSSFYIYKKEKDKLFCGPIWDFDVSSGNCDFNDTFYQEKDSKETSCLWAKEVNIWYHYLLQFDEFKCLVDLKLRDKQNGIKNLLNNISYYFNEYKNSFERNFERWDTLGKYVWPNNEEIVAITTWKGQVEYVKEWLLESLEYMTSVYCS